MRKSGYTISIETLDITMIISDTPTSPDPSESGAGPSGSIPDTPASPDSSGEFGPNSPSHQYESESSEPECGSGV